MYSHMFRERFEDQLKAEYEAHPSADAGERLNLWRDVARESYQHADDKTRDAVLAELDESAMRRKLGHEVENTPASYLQ